jgi:hypothetical protein
VRPRSPLTLLAERELLQRHKRQHKQAGGTGKSLGTMQVACARLACDLRSSRQLSAVASLADGLHEGQAGGVRHQRALPTHRLYGEALPCSPHAPPMHSHRNTQIYGSWG